MAEQKEAVRQFLTRLTDVLVSLESIIVKKYPFVQQLMDNVGMTFNVLFATFIFFVISIIYFIVIDTVGGGKRKKRRGPIALEKETWIPFKLIQKEKVSHDAYRFRFELQSKDHVLGLPIGQHISFKYLDKEKEVIRSYTPVSSDDEIGFVEFVIKVYLPGVHPKFPDGVC